MMSENKYLMRVPLLDSTQQVMGYKLAWQKNQTGNEAAGAASIHRLLELAGERLGEFATGLLFLDARGALLPAELPQGKRPKNAVLMLDRADLTERNLASAMFLRERGFGLALCDVDLAFLASDDALLALVTHVVVSPDHSELAAIGQFVRQADPDYALVLDRIVDWRAFDVCATLGVNGFFESFCAAPRTLNPMGEVGPQAALLLQLMQMVQNNADVRQLENVLKRDATISYKLFRYINSASFGIEIEIQSLRHAVSLLGYAPLYRWLSLLLAMTHSAGFSPGLLQAAIVRGRFAELLGQGLLSRSEAENLFVVGMFSLLDQLLGIPIEQVLRQITLPEAVVQALLSREGIYGPFLALAEACEHADGQAPAIADTLLMTATRVNQAHLSALAWAQSLDI